MKRIYVSLAALVGFALTLTAHATAIEFTFTGSGINYSLNGNAGIGDMTVVFDTDTSLITSPAPGVVGYSGLTGNITISGVGSGTFDAAYVFDNQEAEAVGFGIASDLYDLFVSGAGLDSYDMTTPFGPVLATSDQIFLSQWIDVSTSLGTLSVTSADSGSFVATIPVTPSVPEPATLGLLGLGLAGIGFARRTRKG